jgi:hypothetical protein
MIGVLLPEDGCCPGQQFEALRLDARRLQVGDDLLDHAFAFSFPAVHLDAAEAADREFVDVQDNDMISAVTAELTGRRRTFGPCSCCLPGSGGGAARATGGSHRLPRR